MFLRKSTSKYKHLYAKPSKLGWFSSSSLFTKFVILLIFGLIIAVVWLGIATTNWKVSKKKYRERIRILRIENEALRVEKDLMITRMTIAGLLKPVQNGVYEFDGEDLSYYADNTEEDIGYSEIVSFNNFGGSYDAKNKHVKITFKINNIAEDAEEKVDGRVFVVLGGDDLPVAKYILLPNDSKLFKDGRPDGTQGGATFSMREFKDMSFTGTVDEPDKYDTGMIYVFTKEGELVQIWPLELNFKRPNNIVVTEVE